MSKTLEQHDMALRALKLTEVLPKLHPSGILELRLNTPKNLNAFSGVKCEWAYLRSYSGS